MMRAVGLRLEGPMQSWGGPVAGDDRPSLDFPTKSGILGLVAGALGLDRSDVPSLVALHRCLHVAVRVDRAGTRGVDFHTAQDVPRGDRGTAETVVSRRSYLYDASFAVLVIEGEGLQTPLEVIADALARPRCAPALGRRGCPPAEPVLALREPCKGDSWRELFAQLPVVETRGPGAQHLDVFVEGDCLAGSLRELRVRDELIGPLPRMFGERSVCQFRIPRPASLGDTVDPWFPS